jgi:hypothetical protein
MILAQKTKHYQQSHFVYLKTSIHMCFIHYFAVGTLVTQYQFVSHSVTRE